MFIFLIILPTGNHDFKKLAFVDQKFRIYSVRSAFLIQEQNFQLQLFQYKVYINEVPYEVTE